jgi:dipeptidyl aminopeptidase/acylaminoacyl peptidase
MKKHLLFLLSICVSNALLAQQNLSIEKLWQLQRVSPMGLSADGKMVYYNVSTPSVADNKSANASMQIPVEGGKPTRYAPAPIGDFENGKVSPDGKKILFTKEVSVEKIIASEKYPDLPKSNAYIFTELNNRHWDSWEDGKYSHVFVADYANGVASNAIDIMPDTKFDCPQKPHGGDEDLLWAPDSKSVLYVCKKLSGTAYAVSTNTDIYEYNLNTKSTNNLTAENKGYDVAPAFSKDGKTLAYMSMKTDGYESDKQDVILMDWATKVKNNITRNMDETTNAFLWGNDSKTVFMEIPTKGTLQLFSYGTPNASGKKLKNLVPTINQITNGQFDVNGLVGQSGNKFIVSRTDMNHASELYSVDLTTKQMNQITHVNDVAYAQINMCDVQPRTTKATDGKDLFSWVIYPPNFDKNKKYPVLLYCQGGPQGALSQFYSFRWNFALMASQGYIVVAPNRRGMHGWGVKWNEDISKNWGGQAIDDYLSAFDDVAKESYVDKNRCGAVGASYGGYSVFMLAGKHNNRFKSFIAHDGLFDLRSWYGTTEEIFFANYDIGGPYWDDTKNESYTKHNPSNMVSKWNTPIMIVQGGTDYRVGIEQGLQAFQAAQLKGIKSKLLYLPDENHWVLRAQNAQVWQREFYSWLAETLLK